MWMNGWALIKPRTSAQICGHWHQFHWGSLWPVGLYHRLCFKVYSFAWSKQCLEGKYSTDHDID